MNRLLAGLTIIFLGLCIVACQQPVGSLANGNHNGNGNGNGGKIPSADDFLMLRPNRILYEVDGGRDGRFDRNADLSAFVADGGEFSRIEPDDEDLIIEIILHPGLDAQQGPIAVDGYFTFAIPGRHLIRGTYKDNSKDEYSIEVRGSLVNPSTGTDFVDMIWL